MQLSISVFSLILVVCVRALSPYLFVEHPFTITAVAAFLGLILGYTILCGPTDFRSFHQRGQGAVILILAQIIAV